MLKPTLEEVKKYAENGEYTICPVCQEMLSDFRTPVEVMRALMNIDEHCFMLESADSSKKWGRYTFLGFDPTIGITMLNGEMVIGDRKFTTNDPNTEIRKLLKEYRSPRIEGFPPFTGGLVGYFSYDYLKYSEPILNLDAKDTEGFKDVDLLLFDKLIVFDNFTQKLMLIYNIKLDDPAANYEKAKHELLSITELVKYGKPRPNLHGKLYSSLKPYFEKEEFCEMVEKAKHHIKEGDIFQIVLSNRMEADFEGSLLNTYRVLRSLNPSPYMFYFSGTDMEVAGSSPETLVKLQDGILHTFPLAGTRPRGKTDEEDLILEKELLADPKELAEHNMLVDLGRNDLGKISKFGTVILEKYHEVERYSHVMHIGSTVRGEIRDDCDAMDAISAVLPAGTLSGAPKIRACQIINDLENNKRGIYGGGIGYIDFSGNLDLCIAIRLAYKKNNKVFVRSGAGIVADSVPEKEYQESLDKAAAVIKAIKAAEGEDI
jgi:anthranilate synthase component 1